MRGKELKGNERIGFVHKLCPRWYRPGTAEAMWYLLAPAKSFSKRSFRRYPGERGGIFFCRYSEGRQPIHFLKAFEKTNAFW